MNTPGLNLQTGMSVVCKLTTEVATYLPNGYGLYDMAGGVYEMTWDDNLKPNEDIPDHLKDKMVIKGGTWNAGWTPEVTHGGKSH